MDPLTRARWQRIEALLDAVLDLPPDRRGAFLTQACAGDAELRAQVERLVASGERPGDTFAGHALGLVMPDLPAEARPLERDEPERIGPYRILREIGRGGMGVVFLAERTDFRQTVALKVVRRGVEFDTSLVRRFLEERDILASLEHPNIARLLDGGVTAQGLPYFAMEYVRGDSIDRYCDRLHLGVAHRVGLMHQACGAVAYAHRRLVVHRDLKPSNMLVTDDGTVKLLDFGIAKLLDADRVPSTTLTQTGTRLLTPEYASPEQMRAEPVTPASDVYALGVLLYELLTGRNPHLERGRDFRAIERAILAEVPRRPSSIVARDVDAGVRQAHDSPGSFASWRPSDTAALRSTTPERLRRQLRGDLDAVILQAMRKEPERRYATAEGLARDLEAHLAGRPVTARPDAWQYRARKFGQRHRLSIATGVLGMTVGGLLLALALPPDTVRSATESPGDAPVLAVGRIADLRTTPSDPLGGVLGDMMATNLARSAGLRVVSTGRMYELIRQAGALGDTSAQPIIAAARRAGATAVVDGALYQATDGPLRLDVRVVEVATGDVLHAQRITGGDPFALIDSATAWVVPVLGAAAPSGSLADVTTRSVAAYRFYQEGLRAFAAGENGVALRLFDAAFREDSTFALAAYNAARTAATFAERWRWYARALRLADRTSERERLCIQAGWAAVTFSPAARAVAESLATRYPEEIDGHHFSGAIALTEGRYAAAIPLLRRVVLMDSLALRGTGTHCGEGCQALGEIVSAYQQMDSLGAAEREVRGWIRAQPVSATPWLWLAAILDQRGRPDEALDAYRRYAALAPESDRGPIFMAEHRIWERRYDEAARLLRDVSQTGSERQRIEAPWYLAIALRQQGRLVEALEAARQYRRTAFDEHTESAAPPGALLEAQVLFELGRHRQAAALFDSVAIVTGPPEAPASVRARARAWALTHAATARAAMGDTAALLALVDSIEHLGAQSGFARNRRLHHYVRGLLLTARGRLEDAAAEHRQAMVSPNMGFTRVNLELAKLSLRVGRPHEAVALLQAALRGSLEASNLYVTRTELAALLGEAWQAAGRADSAAVHYRAVVTDWRQADPPFAAERTRVARRLETLEPPAT